MSLQMMTDVVQDATRLRFEKNIFFLILLHILAIRRAKAEQNIETSTQDMYWSTRNVTAIPTNLTVTVSSTEPTLTTGGNHSGPSSFPNTSIGTTQTSISSTSNYDQNHKCQKPRRTLGHLNLSWRNLSDQKKACPIACCCWMNNRTILVDCHAAELVEMPWTLPYYNASDLYSYRYILDMSCNQITKIHWQPYFTSVIALHLQDNHIDFISAYSLEKNAFKSLQVLHLHSNKLTHLPPQISEANLSSLRRLSLHDNPWSCDCFNMWIQWWLKVISHCLESVDRIKCSTSHSPPEWVQIMEAEAEKFQCVFRRDITMLTEPMKKNNTQDHKPKTESTFPMYGIALLISFFAYCFIGSFIAVCYTVRKRMKTGVTQNFDTIAMTSGTDKNQNQSSSLQTNGERSRYSEQRNETTIINC